MNCKEFQQVMIEELDGDPSGAPGFQAHLDSCADCREAQADFQGLHARLRDQKLPDPGEVFFQRQFRRIEEQLKVSEDSRHFWRRWWVPTFAAAAVLVLVIGYSTFWRGPGTDWRMQWPVALSWLAQETADEVHWFDLEDLNSEQLAAFSRTVELQIYGGTEEGDTEDGVDLQDLDGQEMELLIQRLQAGMGGKTS